MRHQPPFQTPLLRPTLIAAACLALATPALAQQAQPARTGATAGMRYLTWAGKGEAAARSSRPEAVADGMRRPAQIINRPTASASAAPVSDAASDPAPAARPTRYSPTPGAAPGLTPASAWIGGGAPASPSTAVAWTPSPPTPDYGPAPGPVRQPLLPAPATTEALAPAAASTPAPTPVPASTEFDPMAPRRDALIYRMQGATPATPSPQAAVGPGAQAPQASGGATYAAAEAPREGARYYSVHRAAGHQPDPTVMPESIFLDSAPIDLAEPPAAPTAARTVNGRAQTIVPNEDPSLP